MYGDFLKVFYRFPIRTTNAGHKFFDNFATAQGEDRDPEIIKLELQREIAKFEGETAIYIAELNHESAMLKIARDREIRIEDIGSRLAAIREQTRSKERIFTGEVAVEASRPQAGGSGSYVS